MIVLMIFNNVPESLQIIRWIDPSNDLLMLIRRSHGKYINCTENIPNDVNTFLCNISTEDYAGGEKIFNDVDKDESMMKCQDPCEIVVCGFIL
jgi:hypothetical protein